MAKLGDKIKTALDESRILILGTQIFLAFQYRAVFENGFEALPRVSQHLELVGLGVLLVAIILIVWPSAYHRMVYEGNDDPRFHEFITRVMDIALLPIVLTLTLDFYILNAKIFGARGGIAVAIATACIGLFFLYALGLMSKHRRNTKDDDRPMEQTPVHEKVEHVLTEARMVLPGTTALLGFQLATMLMEAFERLPASSKYVHVASMWLMGLSVILLMTPAAYHRIVERGEDTERFYKLAGNLMVAAMIPLPIGMCGELFVVVQKVTQSTTVAVVSAVVMLSLFYGFWFGVTSYKKSQLQR